MFVHFFYRPVLTRPVFTTFLLPSRSNKPPLSTSAPIISRIDIRAKGVAAFERLLLLRTTALPGKFKFGMHPSTRGGW